MAVAHQLLPKARRDFRQACLDLVHEFDIGDQQEVDERPLPDVGGGSYSQGYTLARFRLRQGYGG